MSRTRTRIDAVAFTLLLLVALSVAPVAGAALDAGGSDAAGGADGGSAVDARGSMAVDDRTPTTATAIDLGAAGSAARNVETNSTARNSNLSFTLDGPTLEIEVSTDAFESENETGIDVVVADEDPYENLDGSESNGTYIYEVDLTQGSFDDLSDATVTVSRTSDGESLGDGTGTLWYVDLTGDGATFDGQNQLTVPIEQSIGLQGNLRFTLSAGGEEADVYAERIDPASDADPDRLRFVRSSGFETLIGTGEDIEIGAADHEDAPRVGSPTTIAVDDITNNPQVRLDAGDVVVAHPQIANGSEYVVTIEGTIGDRSPITTRSITAEAGGELRFSSEGLVLGAPGSEVEVEIQGAGGTVGSGTTTISGSVLEARVTNASTVVVDGLSDTVALDTNDDENATPTVDVYVSWENRSGEPRLLEDVPVDVDNETLVVPETGYRLTGTGHTLLIVTEEDETAVASIVDGSADEDTGVEPLTGGIGGAGGIVGIVGTVIGSTIGQAILGFLLVVVIGGIGVFKLTSSGGSDGPGGSGGRGQSGAGGGMGIQTVDVDLVDASGDPVDTTRTVVFEPTGGMANTMNPQQKRVAGSGEVDVPEQQYYVRVEGSDTGTTLPRGQESIRVQVPPQQGTVTVHSARDEDERIAGAEIRCRAPEDVITTDVDGDDLRTDGDGTTTLELPPSVDPESVTLEVEHDRYESTESGLQQSIGLEPKTGTIVVETGIDGQSAGNVPVSVQPVGEFPRANDGGTEARSDDDGSVTIDDLVIGEYRVTASFDSDAIVDVDEETVEVVADEQRRVSIDGAFDFDLAPYQARIDELNEEIADLTRSNRDGAIPYYYGSVLTAALDLLATFPDQGLLFVEHGVDPDEVTEAVLAAVADAIEYTRDAMTTKQNVDLFGACSSLRNERVRWEGDPAVLTTSGDDRRSGGSGQRSSSGRRGGGRSDDRRGRSGGGTGASRGSDQRTAMLEELVTVVAADRADHRGRTADRLEETEAVLSERRGEVSTVSPVREQYDRIKDHLSSTPGDTRTETRVQFVVSAWMLDAVQRVFDHPELVDRLEETVF
ncbi:hypothetical protein SAMN05192561_102203 [Halopenitus malekzadehii]|uniref:Uncharacterized protein n=1 Tax=Halopenitus malekzadehii TaxID=1267564 RepID=A0A1H6IDP0_9EURY|nr:hypothetical protein [Halopenitus malekzadehii]SEH46830.1 hypothetical protein SAMN05192561_102203 [Halopenitus malekzadehii]